MDVGVGADRGRPFMTRFSPGASAPFFMRLTNSRLDRVAVPGVNHSAREMQDPDLVKFSHRRFNHETRIPILCLAEWQDGFLSHSGMIGPDFTPGRSKQAGAGITAVFFRVAHRPIEYDGGSFACDSSCEEGWLSSPIWNGTTLGVQRAPAQRLRSDLLCEGWRWEGDPSLMSRPGYAEGASVAKRRVRRRRGRSQGSPLTY